MMSKVAILAASMVAVAHGAIDFSLTCQVPTRHARVSYLVDTSAYMSAYHEMLGAGMVLKDFDEWMVDTFDTSLSSGLIGFTQKKVLSTGADVCAVVDTPLQIGAIAPHFDSMAKGVGGSDTEYASVLDAMSKGVSQDWSSPVDAGRTIMVVITSKLPQMPPTAELDEWSAGCDCEECDYPKPSDLEGLYGASFQNVMFVVPPSLFTEYETYAKAWGLNAVVVPLVEDASRQGEIMARGIDEIYCEDFPTKLPPFASTIEPITEPPVTDTEPCIKDAILQFVHLQDMSWSYTNDLQNMKNKFPLLLQKVDEGFFDVYKGLGSFVDKPTGNSGYPGDYCYREETAGFVKDDATFIEKLDALRHLSGRDWKESQYDAIYEASKGFPWMAEDEYDGHKVLRVVILATDAGPHVAGDLPELGSDLSKPCEERDYPTPAEVRAVLEEKNIVPIFVVTSDIHKYWKGKAGLLYDNPSVLHLSQSPEEIFDAIMSYLESYCAAS